MDRLWLPAWDEILRLSGLKHMALPDRVDNAVAHSPLRLRPAVLVARVPKLSAPVNKTSLYQARSVVVVCLLPSDNAGGLRPRRGAIC